MAGVGPEEVCGRERVASLGEAMHAITASPVRNPKLALDFSVPADANRETQGPWGAMLMAIWYE